MHIMSIVTYERRDNMGSTRYIMSIGELSRKDNSICFRKNGKFQLKIQRNYFV